WQQAQIAKAIREKNPDQLRLPGFLWTRARVCELIERRFDIRVAEKTAGRYLRAWGFSPQKPARRALEQNPELVARWLDERYPELETRALVLDGHPVHRAKKVREWVAAHADEIELQFLPGYSPELNPTKLLNQDVKTNALGRRRPRCQDELIGDTRSYLRCTQRRPHL